MILGLDTSNYKTSAASFDERTGAWRSEGRFLDVEQGKLGLRQSEALFQHVKRLPEVVSRLGALEGLTAVGCSDKPRELEDSYMPCFLAGVSVAQSVGSLAGVPVYHFSHQQGHIASALFSVDRLDLIRQPFLAWHLSGGTTELLLVEPDEKVLVKARIIGGTTDISAGQAIDRCGVALGMMFPAGKYVEQEALLSEKADCFTAKVNDCYFSLSGLENKFMGLMSAGESRSDICRFTLRSVGSTIHKASVNARKKYPGLPILISGGVSVCSIVQDFFRDMPDVFFAQKGLGGDNALGAALLAHLVMKK